MPSNVSLQSLAGRLQFEVFAAYGPNSAGPVSGGEPLVNAFGDFGRRAANAGISLEDVMAASVDSLQMLFERLGGSVSDPGTVMAAGVALAAAARSHSGEAPPGRSASPSTQAELPTQVARLAALHKINRAATANLKLSETLQTIVSVVAGTTGSDACNVFLYDDTTGLLVLRAAVGLNPASINAVTIRVGSGITGRAALEGRLISAPDAHQHENFLSHPGVGDEIYTSQVAVPILLQGQNRLVGILNIHSISRRDFDSDDLQFLQTVAGELAISIENARQYSSTDERLRQKLAELGTLQRVSRMLASTLDLPDVLRLISEQAVALVHAEAAAIFRLPISPWRSTAQTQPIIEYRTGAVREIINPAERDDVVAEVIRTGTLRRSNLEYQDGVSTLFCLPLRTARETVGALCLRLRAGLDLDEDSVDLLQAFSDSAAMAIENAQLYQDAMHSIQTQSALVQEMHHRVRNNLQTVAALLSLQLRTAEDAPWATEIREAISRIQSIAAVHDLLSDEQRLAGTTVDVIARMVAEDAHSTLIPPGLSVQFDIHDSELTVPSRQATIIALLINELAANAISHGFQGRTEGIVRIRAWERSGMAHIEVFNDGQGVPEGFDPAMSSGLGMRITQRLVTSDLKGTFRISSNHAGTIALITFPIAEEEGVLPSI
ncbi:MAG TPA: GAF domain-containing protein [Thermomicrobiales bacterium]|nr:GAF domain-containing protein [Thermomicrobiales bacterium]